ncbi:MAG: methyl-accepting chemotaxis protein [Pseudomonadota bacterium]
MVFPQVAPWLAVARHYWRAVAAHCAALHPCWRFTAVPVCLIGSARLLPAGIWQGSDGWLGRSGDSVLLLALLMLLGSHLALFHALRYEPGPQAEAEPDVPADAILGKHLRLDQELDRKLDEVVGDTESSALAIMGQVRHLYDSARAVANYLDSSSLQTGQLGQEIVASVAYLQEIGSFIAHLPASIERDVQQTRLVIDEIAALGELAQLVQGVSMQSHLLALNAAIEASRAGSAGVTFRVVAEEMRVLASNSGAAAARIHEGLARARRTVESGMKEGLADSSQRLGQVTHAADAIRKLQENFEDISQYYKTRFAVVAKHNADLVDDISEVLGQIQYQDVVRQCIERIQRAMRERNTAFERALAADAPVAGLRQLPAGLTVILDDYLNEETRHVHSERSACEDGAGGAKIELF